MTLSTKGFTLWFTGLPCSGKTSLSKAVGKELAVAGHTVEHLDGDLVRQRLSKDLGFSKEDRDTNIRRVVFIASLLSRNGIAAIASFVSPYRKTREEARAEIENFVEVYVRCPLEVCEKRDVKGLYRRARKGEIKNFTGVSDPYEEPPNPEITVDTDKMDIGASCAKVLDYLEKRELLFARNPFPGNKNLTNAFQLALHFHSGQTREGGLPYITHPVAVAKLIGEAGYGENVIAAGLLHDVLEDTGCEREKMERAVGAKVTAIVLQVTEKDKTVSWAERKEAYLSALENASPEVLAVSCADKLHNISCLIEGYRRDGEKFAKKFSGGFSEKVGNYRNIYRTIRSRDPACRLLASYEKVLAELETLARK